MTAVTRRPTVKTTHRVGIAGMLLWAVASSGLLPIAARAEQATIHLTDGSKLRGEVVSLRDGAYTIDSPTLGRLSIAADRIEIVAYGNAPAAASATGSAPSSAPSSASVIDQNALLALQNQLLSNPGTLSKIQSLADSPEMKGVLNDPDIQAAFAAGNYAELMNNPKIQRLMNNRTVRSITSEVQ